MFFFQHPKWLGACLRRAKGPVCKQNTRRWRQSHSFPCTYLHAPGAGAVTKLCLRHHLRPIGEFYLFGFRIFHLQPCLPQLHPRCPPSSQPQRGRPSAPAHVAPLPLRFALCVPVQLVQDTAVATDGEPMSPRQSHKMLLLMLRARSRSSGALS